MPRGQKAKATPKAAPKPAPKPAPKTTKGKTHDQMTKKELIAALVLQTTGAGTPAAGAVTALGTTAPNDVGIIRLAKDDHLIMLIGITALSDAGDAVNNFNTFCEKNDHAVTYVCVEDSTSLTLYDQDGEEVELQPEKPYGTTALILKGKTGSITHFAKAFTALKKLLDKMNQPYEDHTVENAALSVMNVTAYIQSHGGQDETYSGEVELTAADIKKEDIALTNKATNVTGRLSQAHEVYITDVAAKTKKSGVIEVTQGHPGVYMGIHSLQEMNEMERVVFNSRTIIIHTSRDVVFESLKGATILLVDQLEGPRMENGLLTAKKAWETTALAAVKAEEPEGETQKTIYKHGPKTHFFQLSWGGLGIIREKGVPKMQNQGPDFPHLSQAAPQLVTAITREASKRMAPHTHVCDAIAPTLKTVKTAPVGYQALRKGNSFSTENIKDAATSASRVWHMSEQAVKHAPLHSGIMTAQSKGTSAQEAAYQEFVELLYDLIVDGKTYADVEKPSDSGIGGSGRGRNERERDRDRRHRSRSRDGGRNQRRKRSRDRQDRRQDRNSNNNDDKPPKAWEKDDQWCENCFNKQPDDTAKFAWKKSKAVANPTANDMDKKHLAQVCPDPVVDKDANVKASLTAYRLRRTY